MSSSSLCRISSPAAISRRLPPFATTLAPARGAPSWLSCRLLSDSFTLKPPRYPTYDLKGIIMLALAEDAGDRGDITCMATIPFDMEVEAYFLAKEDGIIVRIALAEMIFHEVDPSLEVVWSQKDGDYVLKGVQFGKVHGRAHNIVVAERVVLNFMQRMSGITTLTKGMADAASPAYILETRKTAPGLRLFDKWAVETRTPEEVKELLHHASQTKTSLTRVMLDNMVVPLPNGDVDVSRLKEAVQLINGRFETESSGNVTFETVHKSDKLE